MGIEADPRGKDGVKRFLTRNKAALDKLPKDEKEYADHDGLTNPYTDSRVLVGDRSLKVDKVMAGIDISSAEVVLADQLNKNGKTIDLLIAHHPVGGPLAGLHSVMDVQADVLAQYGVPINVAEGVMRDRITEIQRRFAPRNHNQAVDAARLLGLAIMCVHTITDNLVHKYMEDLFTRKAPETVGDVVKILMEEPEYQEAKRGNAGPLIFAGNAGNRVGKIAPIEFTGGTEPSHIIYEKLAIAGVGTVVGMHASEKHRKEALKHHINLVIAGHMSSDSLGMNLFLDQLEKRGVEVVACSGLIRAKRKA